MPKSKYFYKINFQVLPEQIQELQLHSYQLHHNFRSSDPHPSITNIINMKIEE